MPGQVKRQTVDLPAFPDLVVIYLGMRVNKFRGLGKLLAIGPHFQKSVAEKPNGLALLLSSRVSGARHRRWRA